MTKKLERKFKQLRKLLLKQKRYSEFLKNFLGELILIIAGIVIAQFIGDKIEERKKKKLAIQNFELVSIEISESMSKLQYFKEAIAHCDPGNDIEYSRIFSNNDLPEVFSLEIFFDNTLWTDNVTFEGKKWLIITKSNIESLKKWKEQEIDGFLAYQIVYGYILEIQTLKKCVDFEKNNLVHSYSNEKINSFYKKLKAGKNLESIDLTDRIESIFGELAGKTKKE